MLIIIILILIIIILVIYKKYFNILENLNNKYKYGIVLCCYNRYNYLKKTLNPFKKKILIIK